MSSSPKTPIKIQGFQFDLSNKSHSTAMVDADDDFDDLYGDLNCDMKAHSNGIEAKISDFGTFENERVDLEDEKVIDYSESDEDDDFRILLNSSRKGGFGDKKTILNNDNDGISNGSGQEIAHAGSNLEGYPVSCRATTFERDATSDQNGDNFRLPRHRNIFDINIEEFNHRPWSHHGADVTDYFNFGMDENSWKSYWELVNRHKNQACMPIKQSVYQTSLTNECGSKSSSKESSVTEGRRSDMEHLPKGRAIEVRCGFGERIPSIDVWRPMRSQGPDVVIPIIMETSEDNELASYKNGMEHAEEHMCASPSTSKIYSNERTPSPHSDCQTQKDVINSVEHYSPEQSKILSRISNKFKSNVTCIKDKEDHLEKDSIMVEGISGYQARVQCSSNSYNTESHSDDSKEILRTKEKNKVVKVTSMTKVQGNVVSDYTSENIVSDSADSEQEDSKNNSDEHDFSSRNHSLSSGRRLKSVAEINTAKDEFDSLDRKKRKQNTNNCNNRYSNCEFEPNYRSRNHTAKHHGEKYADHLQNHDHREKSNFIQLQKHNHHRNVDGKDCFKQKEHELTDRHHRNRFADDCSEQRENEFFKKHHIIWDEKKWNTEQDFPERHHHRNWERQHHRVRGEEDGLYRRELDMCERRHFEKWDNGYSSDIRTNYSERRFEERDRRSLIYKYSDRLNFKNDSFREKDISLHMLDGKKDDWVRMDTECVEIANHATFSDRDIQAMDRRRTHCKEIAENFDIKFNRPDYRSQREISPGTIRFDERINFGNIFEQIDDENANCMFDSHRYNDEIMHYCSPPRDHAHLRFSWRSNRRHVNHVDHCDIRDIHVKEMRNDFIVQNINHHHHLPYEDNLESDIDGDFPEENVYHENFVSRIHMRRLGHLSKPSLRPQQGVLPSHERFVSQKSLEHSDLQVIKPLSLRQRLNFDHKLNNVRKIKVEARNPVYVDPRRGKHKVAVNNHLNGFKGKLATKCNGVTTESKKEVVSNCKIETLPKFSMQIRKIPKQDETSVSKGKSNSKLRIPEDHEVEEGELIEGSQKKNMKTAIKNADIQPKGSSQSVKVVGMYNNSRILETLKKMEKRKERFKEPIGPKQEPVKNSNAQVDVSVAAENSSNPQTIGVEQQRPIRKRKWRGN